MRTRADIEKEIRENLDTPAWQKLFSGVVGRELLAFAVEAVASSERVKDSLTHMFNVGEASLPSLLSLAAANEVPVEISEPSWIQVFITGDLKTYPPFSLRLTLGTTTFTNIDWVTTVGNITLYQGNVKALYKASFLKSENFLSLYDGGGSVKDTLQVEYLSDGERVRTFYRTPNALVDSIILMKANNGIPQIIERYNPIRFTECYKLGNLPDGDNVLYLPDGDPNSSIENSWGLAPNGNDYCLMYLEKTSNEFSLEFENIEFHSYDFPTKQWVVEQIPKTSITVIGSFLGSDSNIDYTRKMYNAQMLKYSALLTIPAIEEAVKGFPFVQDARVEISYASQSQGTRINGKVSILPRSYVSLSEDMFSAEIMKLLTERAIMGAWWEIETISSVTSQLTISSKEHLSDAVKGAIQDAILRKTEYATLTIDSAPIVSNPILLKEFIKDKFNLNVDITKIQLGNPSDGSIDVVNSVQWNNIKLSTR